MKFQCPNCAYAIQIAPTVDDSDEIACPSCGSRFSFLTEPTETLDLTKTIPGLRHFEFIDRVGMGQFGAVWKAYDAALDRTVAIKLPHQSRLDPSDAQMFLREARTAGQLHHPNIVTVHEIGKNENTIFIVSQFVDGITLADWQKTYPPDFRTSSKIIATIANALDFAHERGIVHRDLKPSNILMDGDDEPHLTDFGLAKRDKVEMTIAADGRLLGTPAYMSPEQARGEGQNADRRSDVYSLGVMLFEMITGKRPFQGGSRVLVHQVIHDPPPPPRQLRKSIPRDLETICLKALEKEPAERYQTAKEMALDLERFLRGETITARPPSLLKRVVRSAQRHPTGYVAVGFALVTLILFSALIRNALMPSDQLSTGPQRTDASQRIEEPPTRDPRLRTVRINTIPPGASLRLYPLDDAGLPRTDEAIDSTAGENVDALPGMYLVVAYIDDGSDDPLFHEVYRLVPAENQSPNEWQFSKFEAEDDGTLVQSTIRLFRNSDLISDMVHVTGGDCLSRSFIIDRIGERPATITDFFVDPQEAVDPQDTSIPWVDMSVYTALDRAETLGKLVMTEAQYMYLVTKASSIDYRLPENRLPIDQFAGPWTSPAFDTNDVWTWERQSGPIYGLWSYPSEATRTRYVGDAEKPRNYFGVVGGPAEEYSLEQLKLNDIHPMLREYLHQYGSSPFTGVRMTRSPKPRLKPEDFDRLSE